MWTLTSKALPAEGQEVLIICCDRHQAIALMRDGEWYYTTATGEYPVRSEVVCWREMQY